MKILTRFFWGIFCGGIGLFVLLACFSYHSTDPSFNTASSGIIKNWMGSFGAFSADFLLQMFGFGAFLIGAFICTLGLFLFFNTTRIKCRIFVFMLCLLGFVWLLTDIPLKPTSWTQAGVGGFVGFYLANWLLITSPLIRFALWVLILSGLIVSFKIPLFSTLLWSLSHLGNVRFWQIFRFRFPAVRQPSSPSAQAKSVESKQVKKQSKVKAEPVLESVSRLKKSNFVLPPLDLLSPAKNTGGPTISKETMNKVSADLESVLSQFGISGRIVGANPGPVVTLYEFEPASGIKTSRVISLADDIAREMRAVSVRIAVVPGSNTIGIEMPNTKRDMVYIRELIENVKFQSNTGALPIILGKDIGGSPVFADLAKMPHLLVAGTTGSGKSVGINTMILSLLYRFSPAECRMIMVDPKVVELSVYNRIPHLLTPVVTEAPKAVMALKWAVREMEDRYRAMSQLGVRNIDGYNQKLIQAARDGQVLTRRVQTGFNPETGKPIIEEQAFDLTPIPYIVVIVDEMADLMCQCGKEVDPIIQRLAQMARAVGIHLILATQRPSVDVITGTIKANFPTRISFQVTSKIDSRTILGEQGAEQLLGKGDMLFMPAGQKPQRIHGPFVSDEEVEKVVQHLSKQGEPQYLDAVLSDPEGGASGVSLGASGGVSGSSGDDLYDQAVAIILRDRKVSTSYVQRQLRIGYNRAADLIDRMEAEGVISKPNVAGKREILVPDNNG